MASLQHEMGSRIKALRRLKGFTQAELAELTEMSTNYIGYIERGVRTVSLQALEKMAHTLGVGIGTFFLFPAKKEAGNRKRVDPRSKILAKLSAFLQKADGDDLQLFFKLAKRLTREAGD